MSRIKNGGLDQYGAEPFKKQQFGPAGVEGVKTRNGDECHTLMQQSRERAMLTVPTYLWVYSSSSNNRKLSVMT